MVTSPTARCAGGDTARAAALPGQGLPEQTVPAAVAEQTAPAETDIAAIVADPAKLRIMRTAETLFARRGIDSVSLREIAAASGNGNNNAVQYHFGGKADLVQAVFRWRVAEMEPVRAALLARARADGTIGEPLTMIRILSMPILDLTNEQGDHSYAAFMVEYLLRHRPVGMRHAADHLSATNAATREMIGHLYRHLNGELPPADAYRDDYRIVLSHLVFLNMLVISDREDLPRRDPAAFARRVEETLARATRALVAP